ncbi:MAG: ribosome maturation factor RimM [gamma proteobacterium symbiont of Bathyaustriella thionipta]|nr:ribosome maturation factor RimM [gamma proteobacterium symbiont of Bathyaustriella thionipta]MCU7950329.1 ribosome maturation factor RimM [gamma proteobacterium symbiont of Bathyaustriella thionipta]MCU7952009.1 ribosome maturation factor RimM [gamma proteobacterium symbiont of Bathyaustriella thionipta]MCU7956861.1 ribosome maturation factor RimM [gamma proteobacterium symbiont of Bathyaustriella thionipta]MCU7967474.1 ribosome maturation factor RimM [gamma proteobacterium symbiont of Bathy
MSEETKELYVLGKISGYYGVKGWVKIYSYTQPRENIVRYKTLKIKLSKGQWQDIRLDSGKAHGKGVVAHFTGYDNREIAAGLMGAELAVYRSAFKAVSKNEYYWADLIGLTAVNLENIELGLVKRLIETAANDVLVIRPDQKNDVKAEVLIPFVLEHYIKNVDLDKKIITVDWPVSWGEGE